MDPAGSKLEYIAMLQKVRVSGTFKEFDAQIRSAQRSEKRIAD